MSNTTLFLGDLAIFCEEHDIREVFAPFGDILEVKVMRNTETSRHMSYGFITFVEPLSAKCAMTDMDGSILCGRPLRYDILIIILHSNLPCIQSSIYLSIIYAVYLSLHRIRWATHRTSYNNCKPIDVEYQANMSSIHCTFISYQVAITTSSLSSFCFNTHNI